MIYFILGIIVGIMLAVVAIVFGRGKEGAIERLIESATAKLEGKAEILEPIAPEVEAMEEVFRENEKKGRDTELKDVSD